MEETPISVVLKPQNTATFQRRERRRERILRNSDQRIRSILSGPDGTEERIAPALEGGESFKHLLHIFIASLDFMNKNGEHMATSKSTVSSFFWYASVNRLWKALFIGLIMRLAVSFLLIQNIVWPWIILYMLSSLCDANGHVLYSSLRFELNIDLFLSHAGAIIQNIWCFVKETLAVALFFILFSIFFCIFTLFVGKCCSL